MSSIPSGAVAITFAPDATQVNNFLAELRKGVVVPVTAGPGGGSSFMPGASRTSAWSAGGNTGAPSPGGFTGQTPQVASAARQADHAWERAYAADARAAQATERAANAAAQAAQAPSADTADTGGGAVRRGMFGLRRGTFSRYMTAGFAAHELMNIGSARNEMLDQKAMATTPLDYAMADQRMATSLLNNSLVGRLWMTAEGFLPERLQFLGGRMRGMNLAVRNAAESVKDVNTQEGILSSTNRANREAGAFGAEAGRLGMRSSFDRQIQAVRDSAAQDQQGALDYEQEARQKIGDPNISSFDKQRLMDELNAHYRNRRATVPAIRDRDEAEIRDIQRQREEIEDRENRRSAGLMAGAEGRFGVAAERDFNAGLEDAAAAARRTGNERQVRSNNALARSMRDQQIALRVNDNDYETRALAFEIGHNPIAALRERNLGSMEHDLHFAADNNEGFSIFAMYSNRQTRDEQRINEDRRLERAHLRASTEELGIFTNGPGTPSDRERESAIDKIKRQTQLRELTAFQEGKADLVPDIAKLGQMQVGAMQQTFLNSLGSAEVDINRVALNGPGTEDAESMMANMQKTLEDLKNLPKDIAAAIAQLDALATD